MRGMTRNESRGAVCIFPINERGAVTISPLDKGGLRRVCKHNKWYWTHKNYLWFWVWAHSFVDNMRFSNSEKLNEYYAFLWKKSEKLTKNELFLEKLMFGLRTSWVNSSILKNLNQTKIREFIENWYLKRDWKSLILSDKWILILDYILGEII
jgi:oxygen-independent coproporphyrinogen-3 oxidase